MKKPNTPKDSGHKGLTPNKAKRRPDGWNPSPVKKVKNFTAKRK